MTFTAAALLSHDVSAVRFTVFGFTGRRNFEPFLHSLVCFLLWHSDHRAECFPGFRHEGGKLSKQITEVEKSILFLYLIPGSRNILPEVFDQLIAARA